MSAAQGSRRLRDRLHALLIGGRRAKRIGAVAEFGTPERLLDAVHELRRRGYTFMDAYVPCPVEGLEDALELERSRIPWLIGVFAFTGAALAYLLLWWINVVDFPRNVGGRPLHSAPSFIPITFETAIIVGGTTAFFGYFFAGGMPRLWDPVFEVEGFESASVDGYWLGVDRRDERFDEGDLHAAFEALGAERISFLDDDGHARKAGADEAGEAS